ncbi:unnamed protein product [Amoebophrya sp. A25]|nr:unnamed protein product [Amoebophrya sp. A25]|eukprot:GSA25T00017764001.1
MTDQAGQFVESGWAVMVAIFCILFVFGITAYNMYHHLYYYSKPHLQTHILRILLITPIVVFFSFFALTFPEGRFPINVLRDTWEAVVIYSFLMLILEYMGGEHLCLNSISSDSADYTEPVKEFHYPWPFNLFLGAIPPEQMIRLPKRCALQFVIMKPIMSILELFLWAQGAQEHILAILFTNFVYNVSYSVALFGLYLIYTASKNHVAMQDKQCVLKFATVKMVVFLTFWQGYVFPVFISKNQEAWQDFVLILECAFFTACMSVAFSWREFANVVPPIKEYNSPKDPDKIAGAGASLGVTAGSTRGFATSSATSFPSASMRVLPSMSGGAATNGADAGAGGTTTLSGQGPFQGQGPVTTFSTGGSQTSSHNNYQVGGSTGSSTAIRINAATNNPKGVPSATTTTTSTYHYQEDGGSRVELATQRNSRFFESTAHQLTPSSAAQLKGAPGQSDASHAATKLHASSAPPAAIPGPPDVGSRRGRDPHGKTILASSGGPPALAGTQIKSPSSQHTHSQQSYPMNRNSANPHFSGLSSPSSSSHTGGTSHRKTSLSSKNNGAPGEVIGSQTLGLGGTSPLGLEDVDFSRAPPIVGQQGVNMNSGEEVSGVGGAAPTSTSANNDTSSSSKNIKEPRWLANARNAFHPKDLINDAKRSFSMRYNQHVLMEMDAQDHAYDEIQRTREENERKMVAKMNTEIDWSSAAAQEALGGATHGATHSNETSGSGSATSGTSSPSKKGLGSSSSGSAAPTGGDRVAQLQLQDNPSPSSKTPGGGSKSKASAMIAKLTGGIGASSSSSSSSSSQSGTATSNNERGLPSDALAPVDESQGDGI